jgi:hypothetical protein
MLLALQTRPFWISARAPPKGTVDTHMNTAKSLRVTYSYYEIAKVAIKWQVDI